MRRSNIEDAREILDNPCRYPEEIVEWAKGFIKRDLESREEMKRPMIDALMN